MKNMRQKNFGSTLVEKDSNGAEGAEKNWKIDLQKCKENQDFFRRLTWTNLVVSPPPCLGLIS